MEANLSDGVMQHAVTTLSCHLKMDYNDQKNKDYTI